VEAIPSHSVGEGREAAFSFVHSFNHKRHQRGDECRAHNRVAMFPDVPTLAEPGL
jgi:tripartite-type tricarboxylate transporter receptor subunit TctC